MNPLKPTASSAVTGGGLRIDLCSRPGVVGWAVPNRFDGTPNAAPHIGAHADHVPEATMLGVFLSRLRRVAASLQQQLV